MHVPDFDQESRGDLNGDGQEDRAVIGTIEGPGNSYAQFLWVFLGSSNGERLIDSGPIGGKWWRAADSPQIGDGGVIRIETMGYGERDPACCPSVESVTTCRLTDGVSCRDSDKPGQEYALSSDDGYR